MESSRLIHAKKANSICSLQSFTRQDKIVISDILLLW